MTKKLPVLLLTLSLILSLSLCAGCGGNGDDNVNGNGNGEADQEDGTPDTTAPLISNILVGDITETRATISWTTDEEATSQVDYGTTTNYGSSSALGVVLATSHSVTLTELERDTTYHYRVKSADNSENEAVSDDNTFTTPDTTAPVISDITATDITEASATITWTTNEPTTSQVEYGLTDSYGSSSSEDTALVTTHSVTLSGLAAGSTYHYKVESADASGNNAVSEDNTLETDEDAVALPTYSLGDTWTVRITDEWNRTWVAVGTIVSTSYPYEGQDVIAFSAEYIMDGYTDVDGFIWDDLEAVETSYYRTTDQEPIHSEMTLTTRYREDESDTWHDYEYTYISDFEYTSEWPAEIAVGDSWVIGATEASEDRLVIDGSVDSEGVYDSTKTTNYEAEAKKSVTVEAGTFDCLEIKMSTVGEDTYTLQYYSSEAKLVVKEVTYSGTTVTGITELVSYDVS
jgi:hypothetical protein